MPAYYNEIDAEKAAWLRELIRGGHVAAGEVDERSVLEVRPDDLRGFTQCHFFAGIGIWSYALRLAGWPDDRPVWTGSCPCQDLSAAGKKAGFDGERHLWPHWFPLIRECRPVVVFGEQVASRLGYAWLDLVHADLEGETYTVGAVDSCAAGYGAPHIRQRLYWVAHDHGQRQPRRSQPHLRAIEPAQPASRRGDAVRCGADRGGLALAHAHSERGCSGATWSGDASDAGLAGEAGRMGNAEGVGLLWRPDDEDGGRRECSPRSTGPVNGFWSDADWIACIDGKARPAEPGTFPLAHGAPAAVLRWRGYGDGIVAPQAAAFIRAYMSI